MQARIANPPVEVDTEEAVVFLSDWVLGCMRQIHRGVVQGDEDGSGLKSEVFLIGFALCGMLNSSKVSRSVPSLVDALGIYAARILVHGEDASVYTWTELADTIAALQLEVPSMIYKLEERSDDMGENDMTDNMTNASLYTCDANVLVACLHLMHRIGFFASHYFSYDDMMASGDPSVEHMHQDTESRLKIRKESLYLQITAIHAVLSLLFATTNAERVPDPDTQGIDLHPHHREASLDDFYQNSMLADLAPGFIMQYRSRYAHLFHSISQVVYFHYPQYCRKKQIPLTDITKHGAPHISVLPLLQQLFPSVPVFYEHTGGCCLHEHAQHPWSWLMLSGFVLLVRRDGKMFAAHDLRSLVTLISSSS